MRSTCYECYRPAVNCLCHHIKKLRNKTHFVFLMHPKEAKKQRLGTGRMSYASLSKASIIVEENPDHSQEFIKLLSDQRRRCYLLYPGEDAVELGQGHSLVSRDQNLTLFILDATWPCAKKMMRLSRYLKSMDKITFSESHRSQFLIKHQPDQACLSTIESVFHTLNYLNVDGLENVNTNHFLDPFHAMIDFQQKCATDPNIPSNRGQKRQVPIKTQRVRPKTHRLFFWDINKSKVGHSL